MTPAEEAILAASQARDLCLALRRAFVGPPAHGALRAGKVDTLSPDALRIAVGLAWAAGDRALVRATLDALPADRVAADPVLAAFRAASG